MSQLAQYLSCVTASHALLQTLEGRCQVDFGGLSAAFLQLQTIRIRSDLGSPSVHQSNALSNVLASFIVTPIDNFLYPCKSTKDLRSEV